MNRIINKAIDVIVPTSFLVMLTVGFLFACIAGLGCGAPGDEELSDEIMVAPCGHGDEPHEHEETGSTDPNVVEGDDIIGTLGQPIFMPTNYGSENSTASPQCSPPWSGGICLVPDSKQFLYKLFASSCSSWWQARVVGAEAYFKPLINGLGDDWVYSGEISGHYSIDLRCEPTGPTSLADFRSSSSGVDTHPTEFGTLWQWKTGSVRYDTADIEDEATWANKTDAQRIRYAENIIKHEYGHSVGLGHGGTGIMRTTWTEAEAYGGFMTFGLTEINMLKCYNEDSGTSDDC